MRRILLWTILLVFVTTFAFGEGPKYWGSTVAKFLSGTIDEVTIGGTTPAEGSFTDINIISNTPGITLQDTTTSKTADGIINLTANDNDDAVMILGVDDSGGDDQTYITLDGVNEQVTIHESLKASAAGKRWYVDNIQMLSTALNIKQAGGSTIWSWANATNCATQNIGTIFQSYQTVTCVTEAGTASLTHTMSFLVSDGDTDNDEDTVSLANGTVGAVKYFTYKTNTDGGDSVNVTPATMAGGSKITFDTAGEGCIMVFDGTSWVVVANNGGVIS